MARLIDATRIEQYILNNCSDNEEINAIYGEIINAPTADAEPIKHGRWKQIVHPWYECSECGERTAVVNLNGEVVWNYCPHCGARMDLTE